MAVDDSMAMIESSGAANLSFDVNSTATVASSKNRASTVPSRCGSAPPSFEETFAAIRNSMLKQQSNVNNVNKDRVDSAAEETLLTDPAYIAYYNTHVNLNPRLPPPLISRETRNLVSYARKLTSFDDDHGALNNKMRLLSTHQEELEDDTLTQRQMLEGQTQLEDDTASRSGRNETFSDLIQGLNDNTRGSESVQNTVNMTAHDPTNSLIAGAGTILKPSNISDASVGRKHEDMLLFEAYGLPFYPSNSTFQQPQRFQPHFPPQGMTLYPNGYPKFPAIKPVMHNPGPYMNQFGPRLQMLTNFSSQFGFHPPYLGGYASPNMTFDPFSGRQLFNRVPPVQVQPHFPSPIQGQYFQHSFMDNAARDSAQSSQYHHLLAQRESNSAAFMYRDHRNEDLYAGPRGLRGSSNAVEDPKRHSYLEALKFGGSAKLELSDITGKIVEFSTDQHGSRFIQQKLEFSTVQEKKSVFTELLPHASHLMTDVYGNYVIQKLFEYGTSDHRKQLANQFTGQMLTLSLQMYGCRVIQKALEVIELDQKAVLAWELDGHVIKCVHDQNGNHVIQKCIEHIPAEKIGFIISALHSQVATLSVHPYGCRVIQRVLEHCSDTSATQFVIDDILESAGVLAHDQYGNYVIQHVLQLGKPHERSQVISKLKGKFAEMSQHKYASNVIEKCLMYGNASEQEFLIKEIVGRAQEDGNLVVMMKDQYANYVIQRILEICDDEERKILMNCIRENLQCLKKYTYGKHIVARYEQLISGESGNQEPREV